MSKELSNEELEKVSGGTQVPKTIRVKCRRCGLVFDAAYDSAVLCPNCGKELSTWQGLVIEWEEK